MRTLRIAGTDLVVSEMGFGTWGLGGPLLVGNTPLGWPAVPDKVSLRLLEEAVDQGVRFFDTSDMYGRGRSEELIGAAVPGHVAVGTKGGLIPEFLAGTSSLRRCFDHGYLTAAVEASCRRLRRDCIDLYQLHGADADIISSPDTADCIARLKAQGKIRHAGVSLRGTSVSGNEVEACINSEWVQSVQLDFNLLHPERGDAIRLISAAGKTPIIRSVLLHGLLARADGDCLGSHPDDHRSRKFSSAVAFAVRELRSEFLGDDGGGGMVSLLLRWARGLSGRQIVLVGLRQQEHLDTALRAFAAQPLSEVVVARLETVASRIAASCIDN